MKFHIWDRAIKATPQKCTLIAGVAIAVCLLAGCTSTRQWWHNGFKVGPNYGRPPAPVADQWIDVDNPKVKRAKGIIIQRVGRPAFPAPCMLVILNHSAIEMSCRIRFDRKVQPRTIAASDVRAYDTRRSSMLKGKPL